MSGTLTISQVPQVKIEGVVLSDGNQIDLSEVRITRSSGVASQCILRFRSASGDDKSMLQIGAEVEVEIDSDGSSGLQRLFKGTIRALSIDVSWGANQPDTIVECYDDSYKLATMNMYEPVLESNYGDLLSTVAGGAGLTLEQDAFSKVHPYYLPVGTALDVLNEVVRMTGRMWYYDGDKLYVKERPSSGSGPTLTSGTDLIRFSARIAAADQPDTIEMRGWDPSTAEAITGTATQNDRTRTSTASAVSSNRSKGRPTGSVGATVPFVANDLADAASGAEAVRDRMQATHVIGHGATIRVLQDLWPGGTVTLEGIGTEWNGEYFVNRVDFNWGADGSIVTTFDVGPHEPTSLVDLVGGGQPNTVDRLRTGLTIGVVTDNVDPEDWGRVKVKLPYFGDVESAWARLVLPGAGPDRGYLEVPEINDEVVVAFEHGDFNHPFVLGGVWSAKEVTPSANSDLVRDGKVALRTYRTRSGHSWTFSDESGASPASGYVLELAGGAVFSIQEEEGIILNSNAKPILIEGANGAKIEIDENGNITIEGQEITIKSKQGKVSIEGTGDVAIKSSQNFKAEGSINAEIKGNAGAKLEASGQVEIKGAMVKVN